MVGVGADRVLRGGDRDAHVARRPARAVVDEVVVALAEHLRRPEARAVGPVRSLLEELARLHPVHEVGRAQDRREAPARDGGRQRPVLGPDAHHRRVGRVAREDGVAVDRRVAGGHGRVVGRPCARGDRRDQRQDRDQLSDPARDASSVGTSDGAGTSV